MLEIILKVEGMHCGMCEAHVSDAVRKAVPARSVKSSHARGETVILAEEDCSALARAADEAQGYGVLGVSVRPYEKRGVFARLFKK